MKIIIQEEKHDKHTKELLQEEVSLDNDDYEGNGFVRLTIGDRANVDLLVADLFTALEAFRNHGVRDDEEQIRLKTLENS